MNSTLTARTTLFAILTAAGLAAGTAVAQQPGYGPGFGPCARAQGMGPWSNWGNGDWVQNRLDRMSMRLNLSPEQALFRLPNRMAFIIKDDDTRLVCYV